jgi:hypothetical protein
MMETGNWQSIMKEGGREGLSIGLFSRHNNYSHPRGLTRGYCAHMLAFIDAYILIQKDGKSRLLREHQTEEEDCREKITFVFAFLIAFLCAISFSFFRFLLLRLQQFTISQS